MTRRVLVGFFDDPHRLLEATRAVRGAGVEIDDVHTPFPVHGMDEAMGLAPTRLGIVCFLFGLTGGFVALMGQLWVHTVSWPVNIGGKSFSAIPALIPISFEVTVLFAALGTVFTFLFRASLFPGRAATRLFEGVTDDRFAVVIDGAVGPGRIDDARQIMVSHGAITTELTEVAE